MKKTTITAEMAMARMAIDNALQHEIIRKRLATYNYDRKQLMVGKALSEEVFLLHSVQQDKYGQQYEQSDAVKAQFTEVQDRYRQHVKRARLAFEDNRGIRQQLQLNGKRKTDTLGQLDQIYAFYSKVEGFLAGITQYNVTAEELAQTKAMVEALYAGRQQQLQNQGEAQDATQKRDEKRRQLKTWMAQFRKAARLALHDEPQLLEVLGIKVPSQRV